MEGELKSPIISTTQRHWLLLTTAVVLYFLKIWYLWDIKVEISSWVYIGQAPRKNRLEMKI